jgi:Flp pilus assembly protein TadD
VAKQGQLGTARPLFQKAIELKRDYADAVNNLGVLYIEEGKTSDAEAAFEYGIRMAPDEDILYLNLGRMYAQAGRIEKARDVMRRLLERKPGNATAEKALRELEGR